MNGLMGMLQLHQLTELDQEQRQYVDNAMKSSHVMVRVMSDILDMVKIEAGQLRITLTPFSLHQLIEEILDMFRYAAQQKNIDLRCTVDQVLPVTVLGDAFRIRQILANLVGNGVKFTHQGFVELRVACRPAVSPKDLELIFSIFQRFHQVDGTPSRQSGGMGLGLSICQGLAGMMGWQPLGEEREGQRKYLLLFLFPAVDGLTGLSTQHTNIHFLR